MRRRQPIDVVSQYLDRVYAPIFQQDQSASAQSATSIVQSFPREVARLDSALKVYKLLFASLGLGMGVLTIKTATGRNPGVHTAICGLLCHDFLRMSYNCYVPAYVRQIMRHSTRDFNQLASATMALVQSMFTGSDQGLRELQEEAKWNVVLSGTVTLRVVEALVGQK